MINMTDLMREYAEARMEEIRDAIFANIDAEFDPEMVAAELFRDIDVNEMLAEVISLRF